MKPSTKTGDAAALRRRQLLVAAAPGLWLRAAPAGVGLATAGWPALAATSGDAPPNAAVQQARRRLDLLSALESQGDELAARSRSLVSQLEDAARSWTALQAQGRRAGEATDALQGQAVPDWRSLHERWKDRTVQADTAARAHRAAVLALVATPAAGRPAAMTACDDRVAARQSAEAAHQAATSQLAEGRTAARRQAQVAENARAGVVTSTDHLAQQLLQTAQAWTDLQDRLAALRRATAEADVPMAATLRWPGPAVPWQPPAVPARLEDANVRQVWRTSQEADDDAQRLHAAVWLTGDARAAVGMSFRTGTACASVACGDWRREEQALDQELADLDRALEAAVRRLVRAADDAQAQARLAPERLQAALARRDAIAGSVAQATGAGLAAARQLADLAAAEQSRLDAARQQAEAAWMQAYLTQYGHLPQPDPRPARTASAMLSDMLASSSALPAIKWHALHRMRQRGDEPDSFRAYTYVLVGTGTARSSAGVQARLRQLLAALARLAPASSVPTEKKGSTNVFVVPVPAAAPDGPDDPLDIDLRLAQSLLLHAPTALRLQPQTEATLQQRDGPFLLTLPCKLAEARSDSPVLFADLSRVPEVAVVDVVRQYMGDMLRDFRRDNPDWQPPFEMQLTVSLVRLVKGSGDLVQAVFPGRLGR